jgi:hypothetical protein
MYCVFNQSGFSFFVWKTPGTSVNLGLVEVARAAIDNAWRWFRRRKEKSVSLSDVVNRVISACPDIDAEDVRHRVRYEIDVRLRRTKHRVP